MLPVLLNLLAGLSQVVPLNVNNDGFNVTVRALGGKVEVTVDNPFLLFPPRPPVWTEVTLNSEGFANFRSVFAAVRITAGVVNMKAVVLQSEALQSNMGPATPWAMNVTAARSAAAATPSNTSQFTYLTGLARTTGGASGDLPNIPGGYKRHGITQRNGSVLDPSLGALDCDTLTVTWNKPARSKDYRGAVEVQNDGSDYEYYESTAGGGDGTGNQGGTYYGVEATCRYIAVGTEGGNTMQIQVGNDYIKPALTYPNTNAPNTIDFGSVAKRQITFRGGPSFLWSGFSAEQGAILAPYNFMENRTSWAFMGDGYMQANVLTSVGCFAPELFMRLCGGGAHAATNIYGSGYGNAGNGSPFDNDIRLNIIKQANPDIIAIMGGMEDSWPLAANTGKDVLASIRRVLTMIRFYLPNKIIVLTAPWAPKQSVAVNGSSPARLIRAAMVQELASVSGPWIFIDPLLGTWLTSNARNKTTADGPWQTGDGRIGATTGTGNGDLWVANSGKDLTEDGLRGVANLWSQYYREALQVLA